MKQVVSREIPTKILAEVSRCVLGRQEAIRLLLMALLCGEHVLVEGKVGSGKTLLARTFAQAIGGDFKRIQLEPDLLPGDITGFSHYLTNGDSRFIPGPIFANVILADELNRTTPRTQAAFLEAMQEGRVTVDGVTYPLPQPFLAVATQLPVGSEGTYAMPEGEVDRFALRLWSDYPDRAIEGQILKEANALENPSVEPVATPQAVLELRELVQAITVSDLTVSYMLDIIHGLRRHPDIAGGPSTRGSLALYRTSRAAAFLDERDFVIPDDVRGLAVPVLEHRLRLTPEAELEGMTPRQVLERVLDSTPVPKGNP